MSCSSPSRSGADTWWSRVNALASREDKTLLWEEPQAIEAPVETVSSSCYRTGRMQHMDSSSDNSLSSFSLLESDLSETSSFSGSIESDEVFQTTSATFPTSYSEPSMDGLDARVLLSCQAQSLFKVKSMDELRGMVVDASLGEDTDMIPFLAATDGQIQNRKRSFPEEGLDAVEACSRKTKCEPTHSSFFPGSSDHVLLDEALCMSDLQNLYFFS